MPLVICLHQIVRFWDFNKRARDLFSKKECPSFLPFASSGVSAIYITEENLKAIKYKRIYLNNKIHILIRFDINNKNK